MSSTAFMQLEMIVAIVVVSILAIVAMPRFERDYRFDLRENVVNAIEYTQHLALTDNQINPQDNRWQMRLWKITFATSNISNRAFFYTISSDKNQNGSVSKDETAIEPNGGKYIYNTNANTQVELDESSNIFIGKNYGVNNIHFLGGCATVHHIAFDNFGRPHNSIGNATDKYEKYMKSDCKIVFSFVNEDMKPLEIVISKETGAVSWD